MMSLETEHCIVNLTKEQQKKRTEVPKFFLNHSRCVPRAMFSAHSHTLASELDTHINWFGQTDVHLSGAMC